MKNTVTEDSIVFLNLVQKVGAKKAREHFGLTQPKTPAKKRTPKAKKAETKED
tara:strand:+ start:244 stop:402 length:159 start_codon:yes stop_codon:yes gene_type:complete